jgi:ribosomal-protein-alanine N-acetyltransferase
MMNLDAVFNPFPCLESPRLILREIQTRDRTAVYQLYGNAEVVRYYDVGQFNTIEQADHLIARMSQRYTERRSVRWAITERGGMDRLIGTCGFNLFDTRSHFAEIGYDLHPAFWGQGMTTEAVGAMLRFGFYTVGLNRIEASVMLGNAASVAVLTKLGFHYEGVMRQRGYWKGKYHDLECYALLRDDLKF